jgi:hypothetical protein
MTDISSSVFGRACDRKAKRIHSKYENAVNRDWPQFKIVSRQIQRTSSIFVRQANISLKPMIHRIQIARPSLSTYSLLLGIDSLSFWAVCYCRQLVCHLSTYILDELCFDYCFLSIYLVVTIVLSISSWKLLFSFQFIRIKLRICMSCWGFIALPNKFDFMVRIGCDIKCNKDSNQNWGDTYINGSV